MRHALLALSLVSFASLGGAALARAETASTGTVCQGAAAVPGQTLHGPILHVPDAGEVCVATGADRGDWVAVPLVQPAGARNVLMAAAFGQNATCRIQTDGRGDCTVEGEPLAARLSRKDVLRTAVSWR